MDGRRGKMQGFPKALNFLKKLNGTAGGGATVEHSITTRASGAAACNRMKRDFELPYRAHRNGIKKARGPGLNTMKGMDPKFLRNHKRVLKGMARKRREEAKAKAETEGKTEGDATEKAAPIETEDA
ncbi:uncharacterized protein EI90DRAFT_3150544 [Cantharellus anzutake]|uniref:uncharacterized protein n=1 Tax=Cantharellus anzutake TaxID=1750568 RepID=UPI00190837BA|nr:uncharacterized protein EI90DRAFT_3150544 [Cantharellus anzutake]KAF8341419.1 hypothetical protein EI90DRAFT_3150544 [Cantharellus anzutake]